MASKPNVFDIVLDTHNFTKEHIDALYYNQLLLKSHAIHAPCAIFPDYIELSCYRLYYRAKLAPGLSPLSRFKITYSAKIYPIIFSLVESMTAVHSTGAVMRYLTPRNVYISREIQILCLFLNVPEDQINVYCPAVFTYQQFDFSCYADDFSYDFYAYRQFLAFPSDLRVSYRIRFTIGCDLYQLGACIYEICTGKKVPDAFYASTEEALQVQRNEVIQTLKALQYPDPLVLVFAKLLFLFSEDYFVAANEVHAAFTYVYAQIANKAIPRALVHFSEFSSRLQSKTRCNENIAKTIVDHLAKAISFTRLRQQGFDSQNIELESLYVVQIVAPGTALVVASYLQQNMDIDGDMYAADKQGRFAVLQGYFGSGKTQILLDVRAALAKHLYCIGFYVPGAKNNKMELIYTGFINADAEARNFYHYLLIYIFQGIAYCQSEILRAKFQQMLNQQKDINLVWNLVPGFAQYLELGEPLHVQITSEMIKELLYNVIRELLTCCLVLLIAIDDIQSNIYENEIRVLLDLVKKYPRILVVTSEIPGIKVDMTAFQVIYTAELGETYYSKQVAAALHDYAEYQQQEEKQTAVKQNTKQQQLTYADVASIQSGSISDNTNISTTLDALEIRTKCFAFSAASRRAIENCFVAVNYLSPEQVAQYLSQCFGQQHIEIAITIYRKTHGSLKTIHKMLQQLYQHSGVLANYQMVNRTLELLYNEQLSSVYYYMKQQQKDHLISKRDICVLSACSLLQPIFNQNLTPILLQMNSNEVHASMSNISSQTTIIGPALQNCSLKDEEYGSNGYFYIDGQFYYSATDQLYQWQNQLFYYLFQENFVLKCSQELVKCLVFLLDRFYMSMSYLEDRRQLLKFCHVPAIDVVRAPSALRNLCDDLSLLFYLPQRELHAGSSLCRLLKRGTEPKIMRDLVLRQKMNVMSAVASVPKSQIVCHFDGTFVPVDLLARVFCSCGELFTDVFDLAEIAKIELFLLEYSLYYGYVPQIYADIIADARAKVTEVSRYLEMLGIRKYIDINGVEGQSVVSILQLIAVVNENPQNQSFQALLNTFQLYEVAKKYNAKINHLSILQARRSNFYLLTTLDMREISPVHQRMGALNQLIDQLALAQQYTLAAQLSTALLIQLGYSRHSTVVNDFYILQTRNARILSTVLIPGFQDILKARLYNQLPQTEFELHRLIFKFICVLIMTNNATLALNIAYSLVENSYQSKIVSRYTIFAIFFMMLYVPFDDGNFDEHRILQHELLFTCLGYVVNEDVYPLSLIMYLVVIELHRPTQDNLTINRILTQLFVWHSRKPNITIEYIATISLLFLGLFDLQNFTMLARMSKWLLYTALYINTDSLSQFALSVALASKACIFGERLIIDNLDILRDDSLLGIISSICVATASYNIYYLKNINPHGFYCITLLVLSVKSKILFKNGICRQDAIIQTVDQLYERFGVDSRIGHIQLRIAELLGVNANDIERLK